MHDTSEIIANHKNEQDDSDWHESDDTVAQAQFSSRTCSLDFAKTGKRSTYL